MATTTFTQNLLGFPSAENGTLSLSVDVDENAAPVSRGPTNADDGNIIYVNVIPEIPEAKALLAQSQKEVELASSFWSLKATEAVDDKVREGNFPMTDNNVEIKKNNYKLQAMDDAIQHSGW
jgi:hypothetical protein